MKNELFAALKSDAELVSLLGTVGNSDMPCIFFDSPLSFNDLPAVSFFEKNGGDAVFADDVCIAKNVVMQVELWANDDISRIYRRVDAVMRSIGYTCDTVSDFPEPNIRHMTFVYSKLDMI